MMMIMRRKPQLQTLSIRISDSLREFLERSKLIISHARGEDVSTSDVAKILLESAKDDRLDFRLEVAELQRSPTEAMWEVRRKWGQKQDLSRAEWILLAQYIQVACEGARSDPRVPPPEAFAALLEAVLAVRALRGDRGVELDRYYLSNIGTPEEASLNDRQVDPDLVPRVTGRWLQQLREPGTSSRPGFAGRNFYVAIRDEQLPDIMALNRSLSPYVEMLFRLGARGHWIRERVPVRSLQRQQAFADTIPGVHIPGLRAEFSLSTEGDVSMLIVMDEKDVMYPLAPYPVIREFSAMLNGIRPGETWSGVYFVAYTTGNAAGKPERFYFRKKRDGITLGFSSEEWQRLKELFAAAAELPKLQTFYQELSLAYGEV
jgi:hypothetical protein